MDAVVSSLAQLPTRSEVADYCNKAQARKKPITIEMVRTWERKGWIKRHPYYTQPARYITESVTDFLAGRF